MGYSMRTERYRITEEWNAPEKNPEVELYDNQTDPASGSTLQAIGSTTVLSEVYPQI
jgi:hypothetical protein